MNSDKLELKRQNGTKGRKTALGLLCLWFELEKGGIFPAFSHHPWSLWKGEVHGQISRVGAWK